MRPSCPNYGIDPDRKVRCTRRHWRYSDQDADLAISNGPLLQFLSSHLTQIRSLRVVFRCSKAAISDYIFSDFVKVKP